MATINILWLAVGCLILVRWLNHRIFTGLANLVVVGFSQLDQGVPGAHL
ncbi:MAG: hypothetical protein R2932_03935 [Caldilineaceae bacterium]